MQNSPVRARIWSLLDVLRFYAQSFVASSATITQIVQILNSGRGLQDSHYKEIGISLGEMMRECEKVDLPMTLAQLKRIKEVIDDVGNSSGKKNVTYDGLRQMFHELLNRLWDELNTHIFYQIESPKSLYYEQPEKTFGPEVSKSFPTAARELTDAAKSYATGGNTSCVFHLMRALESGLSCMANVFGVSSDHANWQTIIDQIEAKIRELPKTKPKNWKEDQEFYSQAASHFLILKDAWRNYTAHMRGRYDEDEARRIMENVCGFMQKLATKLHE